MATSDLRRITFKPRGWAAMNISAIFVFAAFVYQFGPTWAFAASTPILLLLLLHKLIGFTVSVGIDGDRLQWRTLFSSHEAPLKLVVSVHRGSWWSDRHERFIDIGDGRQVRVTVGAEFTRLLAALQERLPDLNLTDVRSEDESP